MQLEFICPECRVSGLTPEIPVDKAVAVALKQLRLRCPSCSAIVEVTEPLKRVIWKKSANVSKVLVEKHEKSLSLLREALKAELERRRAKRTRKEPVGCQQGAAPNDNAAAALGGSEDSGGGTDR